MKQLKKASAAKAIKKQSLLTGAQALLRDYGINVGAIEKNADKNVVEPLELKPEYAAMVRQNKKLVRSRKEQHRYFALIYAHYLLLENRPGFQLIMKACAAKQDMPGTPRSAVSTSVLRCIMDYKKASPKIRAKQRDHISKVARAISNLQQAGIAPSVFAALSPGKGNSISALASGASQQAKRNSAAAPKYPRANVASLEIPVSSGRQIILRGRLVAKNWVEITAWAPLARYAGHDTKADEFWNRVEDEAWQIGKPRPKPGAGVSFKLKKGDPRV